MRGADFVTPLRRHSLTTPPAPGFAECLGKLADLIDPEGLGVAQAVNEDDLCADAQAIVARQLEKLPIIDEALPDNLPPLYVWNGETTHWDSNLGLYTAHQARAWARREARRCKSLEYFAVHYGLTEHAHLDDDGQPGAELIPDWPFVRAMLRALDPPKNVVIEKSRDMMASWICMCAVAHDVLFRRNWATMTVSRVEDLVDNGAHTVATLHGKVYFIWEHLPPFLQFPLLFTYKGITNAALNSFVMGFSSTASAGRGPKWKRAVCDEFAWVENTQQVMASISRACPRGKVLVSTPFGKTNEFYRLRQVARPVWPKEELTGNPSWIRVTIHWSQHPQRDEAWYRDELESQSMTAEAAAQELDISYEHSVTKRVYPHFSRELHVHDGALCEHKAEYESQRPLYVCCDFNHDPLVWVLVQPHAQGPPWRVVGQVVRRNAIYQDNALELCVRFGSEARIQTLFQKHPDYERLYGRNGICVAGQLGHQAEVLIFGDATEEKSNLHSRVRLYAGMAGTLRDTGGFHCTMHVPPANPPIAARLETVNDVLSKRLTVINPEAAELIKDFEGGVWDGQQKDMDQRKEDDDGSGLTRSHASSAFGYMIVLKHRVTTTMDRPKAKARSQDIGAMINRWGR